MPRPLVSILIPAYNAQAFLADSVRSALAQTWPRKEIIIVDDGSTDGTLSLAQRFASETTSVISQPHRGAAATRNHALSLSKGDYIQWLDADDLLAPDKIEKQVAVLERFPGKRILVSSGWGRFYYRIQRMRISPTSVWCDLSPVEWILRKMNEGAFMQTTAWLVSRELSEGAGPWDTRLLGDDDGEYFSRVMLGSERILFVPEVLAAWRIGNSQSLSYVGLSRKKLEAHFLAMELQIKQLRSVEDSQRVRAACLNCLQATLHYFYPQCPDILKAMDDLAEELGGKLETPRLSLKYEWARKIFGWEVAKRLNVFLPGCKRSFLLTSDRALFLLQRLRPSGRSQHQVWPELECRFENPARPA